MSLETIHSNLSVNLVLEKIKNVQSFYKGKLFHSWSKTDSSFSAILIVSSISNSITTSGLPLLGQANQHRALACVKRRKKKEKHVVVILLQNSIDIQLDNSSHSNSAGHYYGINIVKILNSGRISCLVFPQRVAHNIFFFSRPQNVWHWKIWRWPIFPVGWLPPNWGNIKQITCW